MKTLDKTWSEALQRVREDIALYAQYGPERRAALVQHYRETLAMYRKWLAHDQASVRWYREQLARAEESVAHNKHLLAQSRQSESCFRKLIAATERLLRLGGTQ